MHSAVEASDTGRLSSCSSALARHGERRAQGIPTLTVLVGPRAPAVARWRAWLASQGRAAVVIALDRAKNVSSGVSTAAQQAWLGYLRAHRHLLLDNLARSLASELPAATRNTTRVDGARLLRMGRPERAQWLQTTVADSGAAMTIALCTWLCTATAEPSENARADAALVAGLQRSDVPSWVRVVAETSRLLMPDAPPGLALSAPTEGDGATLQQLFMQVYQLADRALTLPIAVIASADAIDDYLANARASRIKSRIRRGLIRLNLPEVRAPESLPPRSSPMPAPTPTPTRAQRPVVSSVVSPVISTGSPDLGCERSRAYVQQAVGADPGLQTALDEAAASWRVALAARPEPQPATPPLANALPVETSPVESQAAEDRARSAAERLLYRALQAHPHTRGRFALNQRIDIRFGRALMEIDLLCSSLGIAVEVDGYYHFRDPEAYRRDRRKDLLLQTHDYLVVRFLADDVVTALDRVIDTILDTMHRRRPVTRRSEHS